MVIHVQLERPEEIEYLINNVQTFSGKWMPLKNYVGWHCISILEKIHDDFTFSPISSTHLSRDC